MPIAIRTFAPQDAAAWDAYVLRHEHGTPFHLIAWKNSIEQTFRYRPYYLGAWDGEELLGLVPLFLVRNVVIGKALISSPFAVYGGILADSGPVREALYRHAADLGRALKVDHVEFRNLDESQCVAGSNISRYVTYTQDIGVDDAAILEQIPRKTRYMVRKALKNGLTSRHHRESIDVFERMYSRNLQRLGTPAFPRQHFTNLLVHFGKAADICEVSSGGKAVAAVMSFYFRDQILPYYGASDPDCNELAPNNFMYYDLMCWARREGIAKFDFGRSKKESGSNEFKSRWGMRERDLPYEMLLVNRKKVPDYTPNNPMFAWPIKVWQKLPLGVTRVLGPSLLRLVP